MSLSATSTHLLNPSWNGDSLTSLGIVFQCLTTLAIKKSSLKSNPNSPFCSLRPFPLILSLFPRRSHQAPAGCTLPSGNFRDQKSPLSLLFSGLYSPSSMGFRNKPTCKFTTISCFRMWDSICAATPVLILIYVYRHGVILSLLYLPPSINISTSDCLVRYQLAATASWLDFPSFCSLIHH